jgi:hypothetical protein
LVGPLSADGLKEATALPVNGLGNLPSGSTDSTDHCPGHADDPGNIMLLAVRDSQPE